MSLVLKPLAIENKNELCSLLVGQLKEEPHRFQILDREVGTRDSGTADLVALDAEGRLTLIYLLSENDAQDLFGALSNYFWACENIQNLKKMYPQAPIAAAELPAMVFVASRFSAKLKKAVALLRAEKVSALQYKAFSAQGVPCLLLETVALCEEKESFQEVELARLKKEFSVGSRFLSEEEILEFVSFGKKN